MEWNQPSDTGRTLRLEDGAVIVLHYTPGETTLQACMARILGRHLSHASEQGQAPA